MNFYALVTGIITVILIIWRFKTSLLERTRLAYPLLLASFPLYYLAFAIYATDANALIMESGVSLIFIAMAVLAIYSKRKASTFIVGIGCFLHAVYDAAHDLLFINQGTPSWWLEFCGSIDLILGIYLFYLAFRTQDETPEATRENA